MILNNLLKEDVLNMSSSGDRLNSHQSLIDSFCKNMKIIYFGWTSKGLSLVLSALPGFVIIVDAPGFGLEMTPRKNGVWLKSSIRAKKNGWLTVNEGLEREMTTLVAATASAPSSFISTLDICCTLDTNKGPSAIRSSFGWLNSFSKPGVQ